jgi:hypothetical protein
MRSRFGHCAAQKPPFAIVAFGSRPCENAQLILRRYNTFDFEAEKSKTSNLHAWNSHVVSGDFRSGDVFTRPRSIAGIAAATAAPDRARRL